jgi:hypothetical protein
MMEIRDRITGNYTKKQRMSVESIYAPGLLLFFEKKVKEYIPLLFKCFAAVQGPDNPQITALEKLRKAATMSSDTTTREMSSSEVGALGNLIKSFALGDERTCGSAVSVLDCLCLFTSMDLILIQKDFSDPWLRLTINLLTSEETVEVFKSVT